MTITIRQLHPYFFGEVSGVDLRKPLTPQEARDIEAGMDKYAVPQSGHYRRAANGLCAEFRRSREPPWRQRDQARGLPAHLRAERCLQPGKGRQAAAARSSRPSVQSWQLSLAFR